MRGRVKPIGNGSVKQ